MRNWHLALIVVALCGAIGALIAINEADQGDSRKPPPCPELLEARVKLLERRLTEQDQTLMLMRLMLGQMRQDVETVQKHHKPTGVRYTQECETATGHVIPGRWEFFVGFSEVEP